MMKQKTVLRDIVI